MNVGPVYSNKKKKKEEEGAEKKLYSYVYM